MDYLGVAPLGKRRFDTTAIAVSAINVYTSGGMQYAEPLTDPRFEPVERRNILDRLALKLIRDERDLPFVHLSVAMTVVLMPAAAHLFFSGGFTWWLGALYLGVLYGFFFDRYMLMLHNTSHRKLFRKEYDWINRYIPWVIGPFAGQSPDTYYTHHVGMHHAEGNLPADLSSTMPYQRDSLIDFLRYWGRFFFLGLLEIPRYHLRKGNRSFFLRMLCGEAIWIAGVTLLMLVHWQATLIVFVAPYVIARFLMMVGNWGQHAFIDPTDPGHAYKSSITTINCRYNRRCFNDGYHIGHHETAARHWTDMPGDFEKKRARYIEHGAIVFSGIDFFMVWLLLMTKRYDRLADHFVELRDEPRSREEILALLKKRTRRFPVTA